MQSHRRKTRKNIKSKQRRKYIIMILQNIILLTIATILFYMTYGIYKEGKIRMVQSEDDNLQSLVNQEIIEDTKANKIEISLTPVSTKYLGYKVDCRLEIPEINLSTNVLQDYTKAGLKVCASKYYGPDANEVGNYCIAGHNYQKENMFNHLIDLKVGDSVYLTDNTNGLVEYQIYDIYKVKPQNTKPLEQNTNGQRELTLITCVNYSKNRLVVKAIEKQANI